MGYILITWICGGSRLLLCGRCPTCWISMKLEESSENPLEKKIKMSQNENGSSRDFIDSIEWMMITFYFSILTVGDYFPVSIVARSFVRKGQRLNRESITKKVSLKRWIMRLVAAAFFNFKWIISSYHFQIRFIQLRVAFTASIWHRVNVDWTRSKCIRLETKSGRILQLNYATKYEWT